MKTTPTRSLAEECYRIAKGFQPDAMLDHTDEEAILQIENRIAYAPPRNWVIELAPIAAHIESPLSNRDLDRAGEIIATYEAHHDEEAVATVLRGIIENSSKIG